MTWLLGALLACRSEPNAPQVAVSLSITPSHDTLILPLTGQLTATVRDASGNALTGFSVTWRSSDPNVALVSATGLVTTVALGVDTITASVAGLTAVAVLTVAPQLTIAPRLPSLFAGDTVQLVATATDANGVPLPAVPVSWASDAGAVATVLSSGIVTGVSPGRATITASAFTAAASVVVAVLVPRISANREVAFVTETASFGSELHTVQADGSDDKPVSNVGNFVREFDWSPDGSRLAVVYVSHNGVGDVGLYVMNADGSQPVRVHNPVYAPRWSPDGSGIVFSSFVSAGEYDIYTIGTTGVGLRRLTAQSGAERTPQWSPDGRQIAYTHVGSNGPELWVMDADGSHQRQLLVPTTAMNPSWSPDGKTIAFDNGYGVWLVGADGSAPRPFTANCTISGTCGQSVSYTDPAWSPDGLYVAHAAMDGASPNPTVIVRTLSGTLLGQGGNGLCCIPTFPKWSPDGRRIAYLGRQTTPPGFPGIAVMSSSATGTQFISGAQNASWQGTGGQDPGGGFRWRP